MRRALDATLGLVALGLVGVLVLVVVLVYRQTFVPKVRVQLHTTSIGNALRVGSDVDVRGVPVGRVERITTTGDGAVLTLAIDPKDAPEIPADSVARLLPKTLFGERYVSLQPPVGSPTTATSTTRTAGLRSGDVLQQDTSAESVELQDVFDDLLPLLQDVQPEKLSAMLSELATFLRGQGRDIGDTMAIAGRYLGELNPDVPKLADDLAALGRVADQYAGTVPDLLTAFDNLSTTTKTLAADHRNLEATLRRVTSASDSGTGFVSGNAQTIVVLSRQSRRALTAVRPFAKTFPCTFASLRAFVPRMDQALGAGTDHPGLQADVTIVAASGASSSTASTPTTTASATCPVNTPVARSASSSGTTDDATGDRSATTADGDTVVGLGEANSPQENRVLAELLAPGQGLTAAQFPDWGSLLLGPILRDSELELR